MFELSKIETTTPWGIGSGYNPNIDFCVWILQFLGIHIPPFNHHQVKNQTLQQVGFDAQSWYDWLSLVVATQDNRLLWHIPDISKKVEEELFSSQELRRQCWSHLIQFRRSRNETGDSTTPTFDTERERAQLNKYFHWQEQQYQEAAATVGSFQRKASPPVLWLGSPRVREQLEIAWLEYLVTPFDTNRLENLEVNDGFYEELRSSFKDKIPKLDIRLINYPIPVFFPVPPVSVLVSKAKDLPVEEKQTGIKQAVESLAAFGE